VPRVERDDGVEIHWEGRGRGPAVVLVPHSFVHPSVFAPITEELAPDHRVVRYDARGTGDSTRRGPYDMETGTADLIAVLEDVGGAASAVGLGDAINRAVRVASARPDLIHAVVGPPPIPIESFEGTDAMASSRTVREAMLEMLNTDYRGATRTLITAGNPQMSEDELRERMRSQIEHCPAEAATAMFHAWVADDAGRFAREIGDRLWAIYSDRMASSWFPPAAEVSALIQERFPEAHAYELEDGIVSRPDLTAAVVRQATASLRTARA
jgi:pimeloyl-ACP methyl ester carboxylesterase